MIGCLMWKDFMFFPGFIDMHCAVCDPGHESVEDIETVSMSAAAGGFTTITAQPDTQPAVDNKTVVEYIITKSKEYADVNILPYGRHGPSAVRASVFPK